MKTRRTLLLVAPLGAILALGAVRSSAQDPAAQDPGTGRGLTRVDPAPEARDELGAPTPFDPDEWLVMLRQRDLDRREQDFDRLVALAQVDPRAREFLRELADDADRELAWTARLALRELDLRPRLAIAPLDRFFGTPAPHGLERLFPRFDVFQLGPDALFPPGFGGLLPQAPGGGGGSSTSKSLSVQHDGEEWVVRVTETVDGEETNREYRGESLEQILADNPELESELRVEHPGWSGAFGLRLDPGSGWIRRFPGESWVGPEDAQHFFFSRRAPSQPYRTDRLGVRTLGLSAERAAELGVEPGQGLLVQAVALGTIAHLLGIQAGDVLVSINGHPVGTADDVTAEIRARAPEGALEVAWIDGLGARVTRSWSPREGVRSIPEASSPDAADRPGDAGSPSETRDF